MSRKKTIVGIRYDFRDPISQRVELFSLSSKYGGTIQILKSDEGPVPPREIGFLERSLVRLILGS